MVITAHYVKTSSQHDIYKIGDIIEYFRHDHDFTAAVLQSLCYRNDYVTKKIWQAFELDAPIYKSTLSYREEASIELEVIYNDDSDGDDGDEIHEVGPVNNVDGIAKRKRSGSQDSSEGLSSAKNLKPSQTAKLKRVNCNKDFDPNNNEEDSCCYHGGGPSGNNQRGYEIWDWSSLRNFPYQYRWQCCNANIFDDDCEEPCMKGKHEATGNKTDFAIWQEEKLNSPHF